MGDEPDWSTLEDAYGSAADVPGLLAEAGTGEARPVWEELWGRLCHQGSVYGASYAALPSLAALAAAGPPVNDVQALHLAAAIIGAPNRSVDVDAVRSSFAADLAGLAALAERNLAVEQSPVDFLWSLQALMAFEGAPVWERALERVAAGEVALECPHCDDEVLLLVDDAAAPITPANGADLVGAEARLVSLAVDHRQPEVVRRLLAVFGSAECPHCDEPFPIPAAL